MTKVVGVTFGRRQEVISRYCRAGTPLELRPEPGNAVDPRAIAVWCSGGQIGYLSAELAHDIEGRTVGASVVQITGGRSDRPILGVNVRVIVVPRWEDTRPMVPKRTRATRKND